MSAYNKLLRSLTKSTDVPVKAMVKGEIPKWVNGTLYRNGPGRYKFGDKTYLHVFDGQACVHKFKVQNGQVFYSNKLLETKSYTKTLENNRLYPTFGTSDEKSNIISRFKGFFKPKETADNVNVNVVPYAYEHLYALTETNLICKLDPEDLKITDTFNVSKHLPIRSTIAHPHVERDGSWITMGLNPKGEQGPSYEFIRFKIGNSKNACEQAQVIASIPSTIKGGFSYFHSFAITDNYIVFLEQCLKFSYKHAIKSLIQNKPLSSALLTDKNLATRIHVINKHTGQVIDKKFVTEPQFTFHYINSYENGNEIVLDLSSYDANYFDIENFSYENMRSGKLIGTKMLQAIPRRVRIPLEKGESNSNEVYCEIKDLKTDVGFELPTINYFKNNGRPYKYVYGTNHYKNPFSVIKMNVENPSEYLEMTYFKEGVSFLPSEAIFVENPNAVSEDDGVLLVMVLCEQNDYLSVLDAKTLKEIARADIPEDVKGAFTFHGFFADSKSFKSLN